MDINLFFQSIWLWWSTLDWILIKAQLWYLFNFLVAANLILFLLRMLIHSIKYELDVLAEEERKKLDYEKKRTK